MPCEYNNSKKAWINVKTFKFLHQFDAKIYKEKRKVLLLIDQCPAYPSDFPKQGLPLQKFFFLIAKVNFSQIWELYVL